MTEDGSWRVANKNRRVDLVLKARGNGRNTTIFHDVMSYLLTLFVEQIRLSEYISDVLR